MEMSLIKMETKKTGAVICRKTDKENGMIYHAVLFIKNIPDTLTNNELKIQISAGSLPVDVSACDEVIFRADIRSTSNEVQEQFDHLHPGDKPVPEISFDKL